MLFSQGLYRRKSVSDKGQGLSLAREGWRWAKTWVHQTPTLMPLSCPKHPSGGVPAGNGVWAAPVRGRTPSGPPSVQRGGAGWPLAPAPLPALPSRPFSTSTGRIRSPKKAARAGAGCQACPAPTAPVFYLWWRRGYALVPALGLLAAVAALVVEHRL